MQTASPGIACTDVRAILSKLDVATRRSAVLRRQVGELSCRLNGIGPTGGFCLDVSNPGNNVGGNTAWAPALADALATLFARGSVLDLGAGLALYEGHWERQGLIGRADGLGISSVRMFDGAENVEEVTKGRIRWADLTEPLEGIAPADWVLSLEVGEHIAAGNATNVFVRNIFTLTTEKGLWFRGDSPAKMGTFTLTTLIMMGC